MRSVVVTCESVTYSLMVFKDLVNRNKKMKSVSLYVLQLFDYVTGLGCQHCACIASVLCNVVAFGHGLS